MTTQPSLSAAIIAALGLTGADEVFEIGTGYGYRTALLALARRPWNQHRHLPDLAEQARCNLAAQGISNVVVLTGDGTGGVPEFAPFDAIVVSAACPHVPPPLAAQLRIGGRLVQPVGPGGGEDVVLYQKEQDGLRRVRIVTTASSVRLHGCHGFPMPEP